jgi:hypothetical protein
LARIFASGDHSQVFDVLVEQGSQFRKNQPCVMALSHRRKRADMPNFVFQSPGGHVKTLY